MNCDFSLNVLLQVLFIRTPEGYEIQNMGYEEDAKAVYTQY